MYLPKFNGKSLSVKLSCIYFTKALPTITPWQPVLAIFTASSGDFIPNPEQIGIYVKF